MPDSTLQVSTLVLNNTLTVNTFSANGVVIDSTGIHTPNNSFNINTTSISITNGASTTTLRRIVSVPSIRIGSNTVTALPSIETVNVQIFTSNGTWTTPSWYTGNQELIIVHAWGAGGGGNTSAGGAGGAMIVGYYMGSDVTSNVAVTVGSAGAAGQPGGNSVFNVTGMALTGYGGGAATSTSAGGGGGWQANGASGSGGGPLGGAAGNPGTDSTFGGGGGGLSAGANGGSSIYGGGGGAFTTGTGGKSLYGAGGGSYTGPVGISVYGGFGGNSSVAATSPGGGGGPSVPGARGEVRVYTIRKYY